MRKIILTIGWIVSALSILAPIALVWALLLWQNDCTTRLAIPPITCERSE